MSSTVSAKRFRMLLEYNFGTCVDRLCAINSQFGKLRHTSTARDPYSSWILERPSTLPPYRSRALHAGGVFIVPYCVVFSGLDNYTTYIYPEKASVTTNSCSAASHLSPGKSTLRLVMHRLRESGPIKVGLDVRFTFVSIWRSKMPVGILYPWVDRRLNVSLLVSVRISAQPDKNCFRSSAFLWERDERYILALSASPYMHVSKETDQKASCLILPPQSASTPRTNLHILL